MLYFQTFDFESSFEGWTHVPDTCLPVGIQLEGMIESADERECEKGKYLKK